MKKLAAIYFLLAFCLFSVDGQRYRANKLRSICNSSDREFAAVIYGDGLVFLSDRTIPSPKKYVNADGSGIPLTNIYYVPFDEDNKIGKAEKLSEVLTTNGDDGPVAFAQNDEMMCIVIQNGHAGQYLPENGIGGLYFAYKSNDIWGDLTPFEHNNQDVNLTTPFLTEDGRTLYFAAEGMPDSFGGWDIYVSHMEGQGWSAPENLGDKINTDEWDFFPFLHPSGRLYFSSRGHGARGGSLDIFSANYFNEAWSDPVSVPTLNTYNDEVALVMNDDFSEGYFSRKDGNSLDIWKFEYPNYEDFINPRPIQRNRFCFRLRENSLDTIDYTMFAYEWVINDTLIVPGHDIKFCFPGPGDYQLSFNVTNKVTDTIMYDVASLDLKLELMEQPVIIAPDTVIIGENISFSAKQTHWNRWDIEGFYWDFGNGVQEKGEKVNYQYPLPGEYTIVLGIKERVRNRRFEPEKTAVYKDIVVKAGQ